MEMSTIQTDPLREEEGVWVKFGGDAEVLICSRGSDFYRKVMQRLFKPQEANHALGLMSDDAAKEINFRGMAEGLVRNWKGFTEKGITVEYSIEKAYEYVKNVKPFRSFVEAESEKIDNFKQAKEELETKNS